jgi:glutaredoxin 3
MVGADPSSAVRIYTKRWCWFCDAAKRLFASLGVAFEEIPVDDDPGLRWEVSARAGNWPTVPMVFIGDRFIGGYSEAAELHRRGELACMIHQDPMRQLRGASMAAASQEE